MHDAFANGSNSIWLTSNEGGTITNGRIFNAFPALNKYFDGQPISVERKSAPSYTINDARLCISLMIQYGIFKKMLEKHGDALRSSGFFARALICNPTSTQGSRIKVNCSIKRFDTRLHDEMLKSSYIEFIEKIRELIKESNERCKNKEEKTVLKFDQDAQMLWDQQYNQIERHLNPDGIFYNFKDIASRYMEQVSRVAAILQYFSTGEKLINSDIMRKAIGIVDYYAFQFMSIFKKEQEVPESINNAEALYQWIRLRLDSLPLGASIPKNYIRQYGPICIRDKDKLNEAINLLKQQYRINVTRSHHPRPTIYINLDVPL